MKKLKIAFLSAGTMTHAIPYLNYFHDRGHTVSWIIYDRPFKKIDVSAFPIYDISFGARGKSPFTKWKYFLSGIAIRKLLKELKPDILHGHYVTSSGVICLISGFTPYALTAHGSDVITSMKSPFWRTVLKYAFSKAALVNTVSEELEEYTRMLGVPQEKTWVATLGVDINIFTYRTHHALSNPVRLLCTRALDHVYDPTTIINACVKLKEKNIPFTLTFAAGGPLLKHLEQFAHEKNLKDMIVFMGGYDNAKLPFLLQEHDIYVSASLWDGTSISLIEAMSCGIFPVVSRIKSNQAWLDDEVTCFMFDCENPEELAQKIISAVSNESLRYNAIRKNRETVESRGNRQNNMQLLEQHYYKIVK